MYKKMVTSILRVNVQIVLIFERCAVFGLDVSALPVGAMHLDHVCVCVVVLVLCGLVVFLQSYIWPPPSGRIHYIND